MHLCCFYSSSITACSSLTTLLYTHACTVQIAPNTATELHLTLRLLNAPCPAASTVFPTASSHSSALPLFRSGLDCRRFAALTLSAITPLLAHCGDALLTLLGDSPALQEENSDLARSFLQLRSGGSSGTSVGGEETAMVLTVGAPNAALAWREADDSTKHHRSVSCFENV